jgi:ABC-2 type transport system permease protein
MVWLFAGLAGSALFGGITVLIVQGGFVRQIIESGSVRGGSHHTASTGLPEPHSPMQALIRRELRLMTSNSTFLFESIGELAVFPILLLVFRFSMPGEAMDEIRPLLQNNDVLVPALFGVLLLLAGINTITAAGLSREGKSFNLSLSIPVPGRVQAGAKIITYLILFGGAFVVNAAIAVSITQLSWWLVPLYSVAALPFLVLIGSVTLAADVRRPLLNWTHPQQAVKQNMNVLVGMGLAIVALAVVGAPAALSLMLGARPLVALFAAVAAALVIGSLALRAVLRYADRRYGNAFS